MSYNIEKWKTKRLENLTIPLEAFYRHPRADHHPSMPMLVNPEANEVLLECGCGQEIKGTLKDGLLTITEFEMHGEGSGTFYHWILEPALKESTGILEAVLVWEGGDTINKLVVKDGTVETQDIEL